MSTQLNKARDKNEWLQPMAFRWWQILGTVNLNQYNTSNYSEMWKDERVNEHLRGHKYLLNIYEHVHELLQ